MNNLAPSDQLLERVDSFDFLSVDIFDTLLFRHCKSPVDLFEFMADHPEVLLATQHFKDYRTGAEAMAREDASAQRIEDVTLDQIYACFAQLTNCTKNQADKIKQLELRTERDLLHVTSLGRKLLTRIQDSKSRWVITSDMYLPKDELEDLLTQKGITGWERVFVSGEQGKTKHTGSLFDDVAAHFDVPRNQILHIGDNRHADGKMATQAGFISHVLLASKDLPTRSPKPRRHTSLLNGTQPISQIFTANYLETHHYDSENVDFRKLSDDQYLEAFGALMIAPLITSLLIWIKREMDKQGISRLAFLARDGMFPKAVFDLLWPQGYETQYVAASRRLLTLPFTELDPDTIAGMLHATLEGSQTLDAFLGKISAGPLLKSLFTDAGLSGTDELTKERRRTILNLLRENPDAFYQSFAHEKEVLSDYYRSVFPEGTHTAIFDVGWRGSLQRSIDEIIGKDAHVLGLYFGTSAQAASILRRNGLEYESFAASNGLPLFMYPWVEDFRDIVEFFFSADHGSVLGLQEKPQGEIAWKTSDVSKAEAENLQRAKKIQDGALCAIKSVTSAIPIDVLAKYADPRDEKDLRQFLSKPHRHDAARFNKVRIFSGVGDTTGESLTRVGERKSHYRNAKGSRWRAGYVAQLNPIAFAWVKLQFRKRKRIRL
ncbi:HAD-IA family hydrolase [Ruegeria lacuscaerulensis]|uniref:HAD-IA family hydrolase n=1 Tax=Ruegeria lacuscaerulensis TaxID=55218 RepID=UPI00147AF546|nr:HAD-IA family hydrolase [Ruegeria lacuscaerulensis]